MAQLKTWIVLDMSYMGYRAMYSTGNLSHGGDPTGVSYGILRDMEALTNRFGSDRFVFCFDRGPYWREGDSKSYKEARKLKKKLMLPVEKKLAAGMKRQLRELRKDYLPRMGYRNVFSEPGAEADDIIGSVILNKSSNDEFIIVTGDKDMYQLLMYNNVLIYHPRDKQVINPRKFRRLYGVTPDKWSHVKAMAGCHSDSIKGIRFTGEKTALKFLRHELKPRSVAYQRIMGQEGRRKFTENLLLVGLPHPRTSNYVLVNDKVNSRKRKEVLDELGIKSLKGASGV